MRRKHYTFSPEAEQDLDDIKAYLTKEGGARVARHVLSQIKDAVTFLGSTPGAGHLREDLTTAPLRFWAVYSYMIVYKAETRPIEIVRILHGSQNVANILTQIDD